MNSSTRFRATRAEISLRNLQHNAQLLRSLLPSPSLFYCPMVKANAYGHGDIAATRALRSVAVSHVGVALIEEALKLRESGDTQDILVFAPFDAHSAEVLLQNRLTFVATDFTHLEALDAVKSKSVALAGGSRAKLHLKFNTGMNRRGFRVEDAAKVRAWINQHPEFELEGVATHLLQGEDADRPGEETAKQMSVFADVAKHFSDLRLHFHALNSAGIINWKGMPVGGRPGIALYGAAARGLRAKQPGLKPVLSLKTEIVEFQRARAGEAVSYGATWRAPRETLLGVLPLGYADGYNRLLSNRASVLVAGHRVPVVGRVCMDYVMVDLTDIVSRLDQELAVGTEVVLIGEQGGETILADDLASIAGTISYEILTGISSRVPREYLA